MTRVLGIDTATSGCAVAVIDGAATLAADALRMDRGQSEALAPMLAQVLAAAGLRAADLDAVAVTRGPGAFTGLRIGLAAARALALAAAVPCIGIGTLEAVAAAAADRAPAGDTPLLIALESKRAEMYVGIFDAGGGRLRGPDAIVPEALARYVVGHAPLGVAGDGADRAIAALSPDGVAGRIDGCEVPDAAVVARLAFAHLADPGAAPPIPLYLRPPDVTPPAGGVPA